MVENSLSKKVDFEIPSAVEISRPGIVLRMSEIYDALKRFDEIAVLTPSTYPELSCCINAAYRLALNNFRIVQKELIETNKKYLEARADALFQDYPVFLIEMKEKGLKDCKDLKDSFIIKHEECKKVLDRKDMIEAISSFMKDKVDIFIDAERRMKKIKDGYSPHMGGTLYNTGV